MSEKISVLIPQKDIQKRVKEIGEQLTAKYNGKDVVVVGILKGSIIFMADLIRYMDMPVQLDFMDVSSYGDSMSSSGKLIVNKDLEHPIEGKNVIIVEDIIDSGCTLSYLIPYLKDKKPQSVELVTLLDKPDRRKYNINEYTSGFQIEDLFVVGYGLDYAQKYRNLPYVGVVEITE